MQFIEALKLRSKLFFLFVLTTVGLISVGIMGSINVDTMKKNLDSLYFGSLVPVTELNEILQTYHSGVASTIYKARDSEISLAQTSDKLQSSLKKIDRIWNSYESHFKRVDELQYVEYVSIEIKAINSYFSKIIQVSNDGKDITKISISSLDRYISHIHGVLQKLINYEVNVAKYDRKRFLEEYDESVYRVAFILLMIILGVLIISYSVFKSIQSDHTKLEITTKKLKIANKQLENVSYTDSLTSMHNRRYFNLIYERELKRAKRTHDYITFMMLDIDYFKQYNDKYGHIEGDYALKSVAKVLKDTLHRPSDFIFRLGGEEFGVLLTQTDDTNSAKLAESICAAVKGREIKHEASKINQYLTISVGVVCCIADEALDEEMLISRADEMLYEAKNGGRDRYVITTDVSEAKPLSDPA